jgi:hypothetical protein
MDCAEADQVSDFSVISSFYDAPGPIRTVTAGLECFALFGVMFGAFLWRATSLVSTVIPLIIAPIHAIRDIRSCKSNHPPLHLRSRPLSLLAQPLALLSNSTLFAVNRIRYVYHICFHRDPSMFPSKGSRIFM